MTPGSALMVASDTRAFTTGVTSLLNDGQRAASANVSSMTQQLVEKAAADALPSTLGFAGALMLLALLAHFVLELRKVQTGQTPDYGRAVAVVLVHIVLLAQYPVFSGFVLDLAGGITQGGNINAVEIQQTQAHALARRYAKFQKNASDRSTVRTVLEAVPETDTGSAGVDNATRTLREAGADLADALPDGMPGFPVGLATFLSTSPSAFIDRLFETLADIVMGFIFVATSAVLLLLSIVQKAALVLLIAAGPIVIVLSAFPGPTSGFLFSWVLTLFEVSMWGFTTRLLSTILSARFGEVPTSATGGNLSGVVAGDASTNFAGYFENIAFCGVLAGAYVMVPVLTSGLFRGGLASQGGQMLGQATGFATGIATGRLAGAMPGRGSSPLAAATDASGATGPGAAGAARAGDSGVPSSGGMTKGEAIAKHRAIQNHQRAGDRD